MEKLSLKLYGWKCVLGGELVLILCWLGGYLPLRSVAGINLHHLLFETVPGVVWGTGSGFVLMVIYVLAFAWIFAWYYVWMHNSSMIRDEEHDMDSKNHSGHGCCH